MHRTQVLHIHRLAIEGHRGMPGIRDEGRLAAAVFRPRQFHAFGERDLFKFAALYAEGIMRINHPFHDGNKRTGYATAAMFLKANGHELIVGEAAQWVKLFEAVAAGGVGVDQLSEFYRENTRT